MILSIIQQLQILLRMQNSFLCQIIACKWALNCNSGFFLWCNTNRKKIFLLRHPMKSKQIQLLPLSQAFLQRNFVNVNATLWTIKHSFGYYVYECMDTIIYTTPKPYYTSKMHFCSKKCMQMSPELQNWLLWMMKHK